MKYSCRIIETTRGAERPHKSAEPLAPGKWQRLLAGTGDDLIVARARELARADALGACRWPGPMICPGVPNGAYISEDRVLVTTDSLEYHAWGMLGPALLLNLDDGALIAELRGERGMALSGGRFVLGLEGYDVFDTWMYERNGCQLEQWRSYGHYIADPDDSIRVIEQDRRIPSQSRVVRLLANGAIERGPRLKEGQASAPAVLDDGTLLFVDAGILRAVDRNLNQQALATLLPVPARESWRFRADISLDGRFVEIGICERSDDVPIEYTHHRWLLELVRSAPRRQQRPE